MPMRISLAIFQIPSLLTAAIVTVSAPAQQTTINSQSCLEQVQTDPQAGLDLANSWEQRGGGANAVLCQAHARFQLKDYDKASNLYSQLALAAQREEQNIIAASLFAQASRSLELDGQILNAHKALVRATELNPKEINYWVARSLLEAESNAFLLSSRSLDFALAIAGDDARLLSLKASALRHLERYADAEELLLRALSIDPEHAMTNLELGYLYFDRSLFSEAKQQFERVLSTNPEDPEMVQITQALIREAESELLELEN